MTIASIADKKACGGASSANTGKLGCLSLFGTPAHLMLVAKGHVIPAATVFDDAYIRPLVQKGIIIPIIDSSAFEDVSAEDAYSTSTKGIKRLNLKGLVEYKLMFEEGHEFYRELDKLESYKSYDALIGDTEGNWMLATRSNGDYQGFTGGHFTPELTKRKVEGGDAESKSIMAQFTDRMQWDRNYAILHADQLTFTPQEVPQINGVDISFDSVPAGLDTTIDVTVVLSSDNNSLVEGLDTPDFVVTVAGATVVISGVVETSAGKYTLTIPALVAAQVITIQTFHGATNTITADSNGVLYRAQLISETVA